MTDEQVTTATAETTTTASLNGHERHVHSAEADDRLITDDEFAEIGRNLVNEADRRLGDRTRTILLDRRAKQQADEAEAAERVAELPDFRHVLTSAKIRAGVTVKPAIIGSELTGVIARAGHVIRGLADSKSGKTTVGLEFGRCSITGESFLGFFPIVAMRPEESFAFVDPELGEDANDYIIDAMAGCDDSVVDRIRHVDVLSTGGINLRYKADRGWLAEQMEGCGRALLDSVLDMVSPFEPSSDEDVRALFKWVNEIRQLCGVREMLVNVHMNRSGDERSFGSAAWEGKFQSLWGLYKDSTETTGKARRYLRIEEGRKTGPFPETEVVIGDDGRPVLSTAVGVGRSHKKRADIADRDRRTEPVIIGVLSRAGKPVSTAKLAADVKAAAAEDSSLDVHVKREYIEAVVTSMVANGRVKDLSVDPSTGVREPRKHSQWVLPDGPGSS